MRRKWFGVGVTAIVIGLVASVGVATAAPMDPVNDSWSMDGEAADRGLQPTEGAPHSGRAFIDATRINASRIEAQLPVPGAPGVTMGQMCDSYAAEPCASADQLFVTIVLPTCTSAAADNCIRDFYVVRDGSKVAATPSGTFAPMFNKSVPAFPVAGGRTLPASGDTGLWSLAQAPHAGGSTYAVSAVLRVRVFKEGGAWRANPGRIEVQVLGATSTPYVPMCENATEGFTSCLDTKHRIPDEVFGVTVAVDAPLGNWVFGRVAEPKLTAEAKGSGVVLNVEGRPQVTPQAGGFLPMSEVSRLMDPLPPLDKGYRLSYRSSGQFGNMRDWGLWKSAIEDRADALVRIWQFQSGTDLSIISDFLAKCAPVGQIAGWISTNAMVYDAVPPTMSSDGVTIDFRVAGPHRTPTGSLVFGDYELFIRDQVVDCLFPGVDVPKVATVSVINTDAGEEVATTSVGQSKGWTTFIARNFTFSEPTIRVVVGKSKPSDPNVFATCKAMAKKYKDGVSYTGAVNTVTVKGKKVVRPALGKPFVSDAIYSANSKLDKDTDGLVCEREPKVK